MIATMPSIRFALEQWHTHLAVQIESRKDQPIRHDLDDLTNKFANCEKALHDLDFEEGRIQDLAKIRGAHLVRKGLR